MEGIIGEIARSVGNIIVPIWPFLVFVVLLPLFHSLWLYWRQEIFEHSIRWVVLELRIPREITKSIRAMEQVLFAFHALRNSANDLQERYWDGEVTRWYAFEMVSFGGEIHFYIRGYYKQRPLMEAAFFSYYPDVEIVEVEDYALTALPTSVKEMHEGGYNLWGTEMILAKDAAYPIKTYLSFESPDEEKQYDPISEFVEVLGKVRRDEFVGIQMLIAPADPNWKEHWRKLVDKLRETKIQKERITTTEGQLESFAKFIARSPGETDVLKAVEHNLSLQAFETVIRFIYLSPKSLFYDSFARRGLVGSFNQYAALDLNYFRQNYKVSTRTKIWNFPYLFPRQRNEYRKQRLLYNYRHREFRKETFMGKLITSYLFNWNFHSRLFHMTVESLATLFHPPTSMVLTAPHIKRVESRKTGPPAGLAIYGEEKEIETFQ